MTEAERDSLTLLPFVSVNEDRVDFWSVFPTGDDEQDDEMGFEYGCEAAAFMDQCADHTALAITVVSTMVEKGQFGPLEIGFIDAIALGALFHHSSCRLGVIAHGCFDEPILFPDHIAPKDRPWRLPSSLRQLGNEAKAA